jgi:hypothetical protein
MDPQEELKNVTSEVEQCVKCELQIYPAADLHAT